MQVVGAHAVALRIRVREGAALQHFVVGEVKPVHQHAGAEGCLLYFQEIVDWIAVQRHLAHRQERELLRRPDLGIVQRIEIQLQVLIVAHDLHAELPLGVFAALNGFVKVLRGVVEVLALNLLGLLPASGF